MSSNSKYRPFGPVTLAPQEMREFPLYGRFFTLFDNDSDIDIQLSVDGSEFQGWPRGLSEELLEGEQFFTKFALRNPNAVGGDSMTVKGAVSTVRLYVLPPTRPQTANTLYQGAATLTPSTVYVISKRSTRTKIIITLLGSNPVFVGTFGIAAVETGIPLLVRGDVIVIETNAAVGLFSATAEAVSWVEEALV